MSSAISIHENRTKTGRVSATVTRKIANYLAYGRGRPAQQQQREPRGAWLDQNSQPRTHDAVIAWVAQEGKAQRYTHQLILSVKDEWLTPEAYNRALAAGGPFFTEWRLMAHTDTSYSHAHVIAFGDKQIRFKSESFRDWWLTVRQALETEREATLAQRTAVPEHQSEPGAGASSGGRAEPCTATRTRQQHNRSRRLRRPWAWSGNDE
jgi:hypothetical protein